MIKYILMIWCIVLFSAHHANCQFSKLKDKKVMVSYDALKITKIPGKFNSKFGKDTAFYAVHLKINPLKYDSVYIDNLGKVSTGEDITYFTTAKSVRVYDVDRKKILNDGLIENTTILMAAGSAIIPDQDEFPKIARQESIKNPDQFVRKTRELLNAMFTVASSDEKNNFITFLTIFKKSVIANTIGYTAIKVRFPLNPKATDLYEISFLAKECKTKDDELRAAGERVTEIANGIMTSVIERLRQ